MYRLYSEATTVMYQCPEEYINVPGIVCIGLRMNKTLFYIIYDISTWVVLWVVLYYRGNLRISLFLEVLRIIVYLS